VAWASFGETIPLIFPAAKPAPKAAPNFIKPRLDIFIMIQPPFEFTLFSQLNTLPVCTRFNQKQTLDLPALLPLYVNMIGIELISV